MSIKPIINKWNISFTIAGFSFISLIYILMSERSLFNMLGVVTNTMVFICSILMGILELRHNKPEKPEDKEK
jgi:hypothetical protein